MLLTQNFVSVFSLPVAIVSMTADDVTGKDEKPKVRVVETEENQETQERVVLVTIQSHNQVGSNAYSGNSEAQNSEMDTNNRT